jgi:hypothetical protein
MALWTDILDPATLTGYARAALADYEARQGSLARFLPNRDVADIVVRFVKGQAGLVETARFRAFDAEPEIGKRPKADRVTIELPALGQNIPISEYDRIRAAGGTPSDAAIERMLEVTTTQVVRAIADSIELLRGVVIDTGVATIDQSNFSSADNFGRDAALSFTAPALWSVGGTDGLGQLQDWVDLYEEKSGGATPGAIVMGRSAFRNFGALDQMQTVLVGGGSRNATDQQVQDTLAGHGLPPMEIYRRRVNKGGVMTSVLDPEKVYLLPEPVDPDAWEDSEMGATFWGRTLSSMEADWAIEDDEQPGIVAGAWKHDKPPHGAEIIGDAIGLPVLANANLSMAVKVL